MGGSGTSVTTKHTPPRVMPGLTGAATRTSIGRTLLWVICGVWGYLNFASVHSISLKFFGNPACDTIVDTTKIVSNSHRQECLMVRGVAGVGRRDLSLPMPGI